MELQAIGIIKYLGGGGGRLSEKFLSA